MKDLPDNITEDMLRESGAVEKAMAKAFNLAPPPMPEFKETPPMPSYAQALEDDELDALQAAGAQHLHLQELLNQKEH